ncbi:MAG TPA: amidohydrolase [Calditerricola sp.]
MGHNVLIRGGTIYTFDPAQPVVTALYAENGRVVALGDDAELRLWFARPDVDVLDLEGGAAVPGLTDSHVHLLGVGQRLARLDLSGVPTLAALLERVRAAAERTPPGKWIVGAGWDESRLLERRPPTRDELDCAAPNHPVLLVRVCTHAAVANSAALRLAGITAQTADPPGGRIVRDGQGRPTGLLLEAARWQVERTVPPPTEDDLVAMLHLAVRAALARGLVAVHTEDARYFGGWARVRRVYRRLWEEKGLPLRVIQLVSDSCLDEWLADRAASPGEEPPWFRTGPVKLFVDGTLGARTAHLREPYADDPGNRGMAVFDDEALRDKVARARAAGLFVAVHAIGDAALEQVLRALAALPPRPGQRDRLVHLSLTAPDLLARLSRLPVAADIQPAFAADDAEWIVQRLGPQRLRWTYAWRSLLATGIPCAGGSDAPVASFDPLRGIHAAVVGGRTAAGPVPVPGETLDVETAFRLYAVGGAAVAGEEAERGTLSAGKRADLTVFGRDPLAEGRLDPDALLEARVTLTIVEGKVAFQDEALG